MKKIFDYSTLELFQMLNASSENLQIEAKGNDDVLRSGKDGKSNKFNFRTLMETVCSFSNEPGLGGGVILLGVGERKDDLFQRFFAEGIKDTDQVQLDIATQCKTVFNTPVYPKITIEQIDKCNVLKICVPELPPTRKPLYFKSQGLPEGAYRRIGSSDLSCTDEDLYVFYQNVESYDETPIRGASVKDVDPEALNRYRTLRAKVNPAAEELTYNDQELLEALGCVSSDNPEQLTLAGVLLFGSAKLQRRVIPMVRIDYIRVPGNEWIKNPDDSFHTIDMRGPLLLLVFRIINAVNDDIPKEFHLEEGDLQAKSLGLPVSVLREAIVNAMMHRSYRVDRPTQVIRYDNRIEIINAGYSLKDEEKYNRPGSEIRNKFIAPVFHDTNLAETKGSGIKRMRELMMQAHLAAPTFESDRTDNSFTARFLLHHFLGEEDLLWLKQFASYELNDQQKTALIFLRETGALDNLTYRQMNNCDTLKASRDLRAMRDDKLLEDRGKGSATYYVPGEALLSALHKRSHEDASLNNQETVLNTPEESLNPHGERLQPAMQERYHGNNERYHGSHEIPLASAPTPRDTVLNPHVQSLNTQAQALNTHDQILIPQDPEISTHAGKPIPQDLLSRLQSLKKRERDKTILKELLLELCAIAPMTKKELSMYLKRREDYLKTLFLSPMIASGELKYLYPEMVKHPKQAYITSQPLKDRHE